MAPINSITGTGLPLRGNDLDTDRIMPARFLRAVTFDGLERHLFEDDRAADPSHAFNNPRYKGAAVLVVNKNFGCGSSREHAPQGLRRAGIRAVAGESFAEIFFGNSLMIGLACVTAAPRDIEALMTLVERDPATKLRVDLRSGVCEAGRLTVPVSTPANVRDALMTGAWDTTGLLMDRYEEVNAISSRLPYLNGFSSPQQS